MTYVNDPIGDLLTRIRNAQGARSKSTHAPWSRIKQELCNLLVREGMIQKVDVIGEKPKQDMIITFVPGKTLVLTRISKPGRRMYSPAAELKPVERGYGISILTTSEGLLTDKEARKRKVGGEVLCTIS
jgi:small subunit ribosomal protein S8